jgi:hypothetical protein
MSTFAAKFKRCLILYFSILLLIGCSPEWHLKRAVQKDPSILQMKTMIVTDTVVTEPIAVRDTVTLSQVDTVEIIKDRFRVKIMRSYDTLIIDGGCDADTIVRTIEVPVQTLSYTAHDKWYHKLYKYSFWVLVLFFLFTIIKSFLLPKWLK